MSTARKPSGTDLRQSFLLKNPPTMKKLPPLRLMLETVEEADELQAYLHGRSAFFKPTVFSVFEDESKPENLMEFAVETEEPVMGVGGIQSDQGVLNLAVFNDSYSRSFSLLAKNIELNFGRKYDGLTFDIRDIKADRPVKVSMEYQVIADHSSFVTEEQERWLVRNFVGVLIREKIQSVVENGLAFNDYRVN